MGAAVDGDPEGLALAAKTREALKRKRTEDVAASDPSQALRKAPRPSATCTHEVAIPEGFDCASIKLDAAVYGSIHEPCFNGELCKQYPFTLDPFQKMSTACVERNESVLVAAHTSAGKTVVAEYAIAKCLANQQRVIYTSPLKALSNQKYRELEEEFGDVGLMTGDVTISPNAQCIVMTTEILRSMLYRGSEMMREIAWVVFDEVHYMQDRERGVVWEETIIFLPHQVRMVFLSATLANSSEFSAWIAATHHQPCHVVYTDFRPTPLQHYAFPYGGKGLFQVVEEKGNFKSGVWQSMQKAFEDIKRETNGSAQNTSPGRGRGRGRGGRGGRGGRNPSADQRDGMARDVKNILKTIRDMSLQPVIFFSFQRRECEAFALEVSRPEEKGKFDLTTPEQKEQIEEVWNNALEMLGDDDRQLPAIQHIKPMLLKGIGVHHSGLLPILKELIEILFQEGYIKALFTTETFAMGVNMPARTVVFTAMRKWDGVDNRWMSSGEYIQMSGRAGRRGKDDRGIVIFMTDDSMDEDTCKSIVLGKAAPLMSSFKLSYYTLLNLMRRTEGLCDMEDVIKQSFQQFQHERQIPKEGAAEVQVEEQLRKLEEEMGADSSEEAVQLQEVADLRRSIAEQERVIRTATLRPEVCLAFLQPGRLVKVTEGSVEWGWGVVVAVVRNPPPRGVATSNRPCHAQNYTVDTLLVCSPAMANSRPQPGQLQSSESEMHVIPVPMTLLTAISSLRIVVPRDLRPADDRRSVLVSMRTLVAGHKDGLPLLDPINDMGVDDAEVQEAVRKLEDLEVRMAKHPLSGMKDDDERRKALQERAEKQLAVAELKRQMKGSQLTSFREEARSRSMVLRKLGHIDEDGVVQLKGRAACEVESSDELLTVELMFNGVFNDLDKHKLVALVSCLLKGSEKSKEDIKLSKELANPLSMLQQAAKHIAEVSQESGIAVDTDEYVKSFGAELMDVVYSWSKGARFADVCALTDIFEGSIIRNMRRLDELMQQLKRAAVAVGNETLANKFEESNATIRRDIAFAASLYI